MRLDAQKLESAELDNFKLAAMLSWPDRVDTTQSGERFDISYMEA